MQDELAKAGILAKQFREYYDKKYAIDPTTGEPLYPDARLETIADMVLDILNSKNEEVKKEEIIDAVFQRVGKQYDNELTRADIANSLTTLIRKNKITRTAHGLYGISQSRAS